MREDYLWCYQTLNVSPGASWEEVRRAYQRMVRLWHPDRFPDGHSKAREAGERIKLINAAFNRLNDYRKVHGALPVSTVPPPNTARPIDTAPSPERTDSWMSVSVPLDDNPLRIRGIGRAFLAMLLVALAWIFWPTFESDRQLAPTSSAPGNAQPRYSETDAGAADSTFTIGSSFGEVHRIQGPPTRTDDDTWYYGHSKVFFENGLVSYWEFDPTNPLKTRLAPRTRQVDAHQSGFTLGSTKAEVLAAQGQPLRTGDFEWDYGASKVYFENGRVSGWHESSLDPLRIRRTQP